MKAPMKTPMKTGKNAAHDAEMAKRVKAGKPAMPAGKAEYGMRKGGMVKSYK